MSDPWARTRTLDVIGVETPIFEAGPEGAPPIVLLHGNPDTHAVWNGVVSRLAATHRCIAPDMPDFGASVAPPDFDVSLSGQSRFVDALFDALELPRANLVCHDVGATYGLAFGSEHADRLRGPLGDDRPPRRRRVPHRPPREVSARVVRGQHDGADAGDQRALRRHYSHSVSSSRSYSCLHDGRLLIARASDAIAGHRSAGAGMLRDHRISIVA